MPVGDQGQKDEYEKSRKGIPVDRRGFVNFARNAADKPLKDPHGQGNIEEAMSERHGPDRVEQANRVVELEEWHCENGGRRHQIGQEPEEQVLVAHERVAIERIGSRQGDGHRNYGIDRHISEGNAEGVNPGRIIENVDVFLQRRMSRPQRQPRDNVGVGP